jgi:hypothetical protein
MISTWKELFLNVTQFCDYASSIVAIHVAENLSRSFASTVHSQDEGFSPMKILSGE